MRTGLLKPTSKKTTQTTVFIQASITITTKIASVAMVTITPMNSAHLQGGNCGGGGNLFILEMPACRAGSCASKGDNLESRRIMERQLRRHVGCSFSHSFSADSRRHGGSSTAASRSESSGRATIKSRQTALTGKSPPHLTKRKKSYPS